MLRSRRPRFMVLILASFAALLAAGGAVAQLGGMGFFGFPVPSTIATAIAPNGVSYPAVWFGGDGGYPSSLPNGNVFFGFGDPILGPGPGSTGPTVAGPIGPQDSTARYGDSVISHGGGNSVAVIQPSGNGLAYQHYFRSTSTPDPTSGYYTTAPFFQIIPQQGASLLQTQQQQNTNYQARYQIKKGFSYQGAFYVLANFITTPPGNSGALVVEDTILIRVPASQASLPPSQWTNYDYLNVGDFQSQGYSNVASGVAAPCFFGTEVYLPANSNYVYFYAVHNFHPTNPNIDLASDFVVYIVAIPLNNIVNQASNTDLSSSALYLSKNGVNWVSGLYDPNATSTPGQNGSPVHSDNYYEVGNQDTFACNSFSVRYNATKGVFQSVWSYDKYISQTQQGIPNTLGNTIWFGTSNSAFGPFTNNATQIATFPTSPTPAYTKTNSSSIFFGYATHEVPAFETSDSQIFLTFTLGSTNFSDYFLENESNQQLYSIAVMQVANPLP